MISRRTLLRVGSVGLAGLTLPRMLRGELWSAKAKACLLIYLDGGASHIDLLDLKPQAPAEIRGPWLPIATSVPGIQLGELLPRVAAEMQHLTLVRSMRHAETVHDPAVYQMLTGYKHVSSAGGLKVEDDDLPQMGAAFGFADHSRAVMPKVIELPETMRMESRILPGQGAGILGPAFDPLTIEVTPDLSVRRPQFQPDSGSTANRINRRASLLAQFNRELCRLQDSRVSARLDTFQQQALDILSAPQIDAAFQLDRESPAVRDRYGRHRHGQAVLLARRLIEAGARFVTVYWGHEDQDWADGRGPRPANNPWDTHRNHFPLVKDSLAPRADQTLSALIADLHQRGLLSETLVVWMGDFGRTPRISRPWASRDHWPGAFSLLLAGGGIQGGRVYGVTDGSAAEVTSDPVTPADLTATVFKALGVDPAQIVKSSKGQEHRLSTGRTVREWFV